MTCFAEQVAPPAMTTALRAAEPITDVVHYHSPSSQWRRYDEMRRLSEGLLVAGEAMCTFNPRYAHGMEIAVLDAKALGGCLSVKAVRN
ncbi:MAG: hypothetical protein ACRDUX_32180 [Mycobacterium sp.]